MNLSARYINALRQLPQFQPVIGSNEPLTHMMSGVRVIPLGELTDSEDESGIFQIVYPGGHSVQVLAHAYYKLALIEGVQWELNSSLGDFVPLKQRDAVQRRIVFLDEHLTRKHGLA